MRAVAGPQAGGRDRAVGPLQVRGQELTDRPNGCPYNQPAWTNFEKEKYENLLESMQVELNSLARWLKHTGTRMLVLIEGRDTAGKGGLISAIAERLNPRQVHVVGLSKPTERERTQWYFQRYVPHLPAAGELVLFDRSWYNRAGVEKVDGFCTSGEYELFLKQAPVFEKMLVDDGILLHKYWLTVDQTAPGRAIPGARRGSAETLEALAHRSRSAGTIRRVRRGP